LVPFCGAAAWAHRRALLAQWRRLAVLGGLGVAAFNSVLYVALQYATLPIVNAEVKFPISAEVIFPTFGIW
jgi:hypothetical protein